MMTPIISSGLVPSGVDIESEREGRHTEALVGPEPDSIQKLRGRAAFMRSSAFEVSDHGWLADAMSKLADEIEEEMRLAERIHAASIARLEAALAKHERGPVMDTSRMEASQRARREREAALKKAGAS